MKVKIADKLHEVHIVLENALNNEEVSLKLAAFKYDKKRLREGKSLYERVTVLQAQQQKEYGDQYEATDALKIARKEAHEVYMKHLTIGRIALEGRRGLWKTLQMAGPRKRALAGWLRQAQVFYENIGEAIKEMAFYGVEEAELAQASAMVEAVAEASARQKQGEMEARAATQRRDEAFEELDHWMSRFLRIARLALKEDLPVLETPQEK